mgnify:FL=1
MIRLESKGDWAQTKSWFRKVGRNDYIRQVLEHYASKGVAALASATPARSGLTAASWSSEVRVGSGTSEIIWTNSNVNNGVNIAVILQYGHGTGTGGYVAGEDYINPAIKPVMDQIATDILKAVKS